MSDAPELLPCDYCEDGGHPQVCTNYGNNSKSFYVGCGRCHAQGPSFGCRNDGPLEAKKAEAIAAWNTRADLAQQPPDCYGCQEPAYITDDKSRVLCGNCQAIYDSLPQPPEPQDVHEWVESFYKDKPEPSTKDAEAILRELDRQYEGTEHAVKEPTRQAIRDLCAKQEGGENAST